MSALCLIISLKKISPHSAHPSLASPHRCSHPLAPNHIGVAAISSCVLLSYAALPYSFLAAVAISPRTHPSWAGPRHPLCLAATSVPRRAAINRRAHSALACHGHDVHRATTPPTPPGEGRHRPRHHLLLLAKDTTIGRSVSSVSDISDVCCKCYI
jgi:hypothetical protein